MTTPTNRHHFENCYWIAILLTLGLIVRFSGLPARAQTPGVTPGVTPAAGADQQASRRWPMRIDTSARTITVYQPQMTNFDGDKLSARAAVSVIPPGQQDPTFGAIWMESRVATDRVARTVQILDVTVTRARFPDAGGPTEQALTDAMRSTLPQQPMTLSLDQLQSMLEVVEKEKQAVKDISSEAPKIIFRDHAAVLVQFDGAPRLSQSANSNLLRAVNTPFFVALEPQVKTYFLKGGGQWFAASDPMGPYQSVNTAPPAIAALADSSGYKDPEQALSPAQAAGIEIVTSTEPSELIWTDGPEQMATLGNTDLLYVANTDCDIFLQIESQTIYTLLSGRWYSAPHRTGPWTYVAPDKMPGDFALIPADSPKGHVLANIAGTQTAKDAVADTFVPQTAAIDRKTFEQPAVQYDGEPSFVPVENTTISYAVNSPNSVVLVDHRYYCCSSAVWYVAPEARGPWGLCTEVPQVIYTLPPSCPVYSCRYVYVYDVTPDVVYCGYLPGYVGCYHWDGVVVYGTGYRYRPWEGREYYPRPCTYGFGARYDEYRNHWGFSVGLAFGSGDAWFGEHHDTPDREWFGHGGYRPAEVRNVENVNIYRTNITNVTVNRTDVHREEINVYERRKDVRREVTARPEVRTSHTHEPQVRDKQPHQTAKAPEKADDRRASGSLNDGSRDNVFVDAHGDVYRKTLDGWERRDHNQWVTSPETKVEPKAGNSGVVKHDEQPVGKEPATPQRDPRSPVKEPVDHPQQPRVVEKPAVEAPQEPKSEPKVDRHVAAPPAPAEPDRGDLNRDYRARVAGGERSHDAPPPPPQVAPAHEAPAHEAPAHEAPAHEAPAHSPAADAPSRSEPHAGGGTGGGGSPAQSGGNKQQH